MRKADFRSVSLGKMELTFAMRKPVCPATRLKKIFVRIGANDKDDNSITALEIQSRIKGASWQSRGLVLRKITAKDGWFCHVGTFEYVTSRDSRQQNETAEASETRAALQLDWFRHQPYDTVVIV